MLDALLLLWSYSLCELVLNDAFSQVLIVSLEIEVDLGLKLIDEELEALRELVLSIAPPGSTAGVAANTLDS